MFHRETSGVGKSLINHWIFSAVTGCSWEFKHKHVGTLDWFNNDNVS